MSLRQVRPLGENLNAGQSSLPDQYVILRRGEDVIFLNPDTRRWYFTSPTGESIYHCACAYGEEEAARAVDLTPSVVSEFLRDLKGTLSRSLPPAAPTRGCSVYVTDACNMRCVHCRFACAKSQATLSSEQVQRYLQEEARRGAQFMTVTGGEPLLAWDLAREAIVCARQFGMETTLLTNGSLIRPEIAEFLAAHRCGVQVSVDSVDPNRYEAFRRYPFSPVAKGIEQLVRAGVRVTISCTLTRETLEGVDRINDFALRHGVWSVHFALLERGGRARGSWERLGVSDQVLIEFFDRLADRYFNGLREKLRIDDFEMYMQQVVHPPTLEGCNCAVAVTSLYEDGCIYGCTNLAGQAMFCLGAVGADSAARCILEERIRRSLPTINEIPRCQVCPFRWVCLGGCRDRVMLANNGDLHHPDPYCEVLYALFHRLLFEAARLLERDRLEI